MSRTRTGRRHARQKPHQAVLDRQQITTGTLSEIRALLPKRLATEPVHGLDIELDDSDRFWRSQGPGKPMPKFPDSDVQAAIIFIDRTGIVGFLLPLLLAAKQKAGRPCDVPLRALLVAMWLCARSGKPMHLRAFRDLLAHQINPQMQDALGLRNFTCPHDATEEPDKRAAWDLNAEASVARAFHRMLAPLDPSIYVKNNRWSWQKLNSHLRSLTLEEQIERQLRLDWVCNQMLHTSWLCLPRRVRRQYRRADICIDATPMAVPAYGPSSSSGNASTDPDAGYYVREDSHIDPMLLPEEDARPKVGKKFWAYEIHVSVGVDRTPGARQHIPALALSMTTDRPGVKVADNTRRVLASLLERGFKPGLLTGDRLYTEMEASTFQMPAREAGFELVLAYKLRNLGGQGTHSSGVVWADGNAFCPALPDPLREASADLANGLITLEQYQRRLAGREVYLMRTQQAETDGQKLRLSGLPKIMSTRQAEKGR